MQSSNSSFPRITVDRKNLSTAPETTTSITRAELLVNCLIELGKPFDFMTYPGRTHAIVEGPGTAYHLYSLLARYLEEHLPPNIAGN